MYLPGSKSVLIQYRVTHAIIYAGVNVYINTNYKNKDEIQQTRFKIVLVIICSLWYTFSNTETHAVDSKRRINKTFHCCRLLLMVRLERNTIIVIPSQ